MSPYRMIGGNWLLRASRTMIFLLIKHLVMILIEYFTNLFFTKTIRTSFMKLPAEIRLEIFK